jgi:hypothetical protein
MTKRPVTVTFSPLFLDAPGIQHWIARQMLLVYTGVY